ncbi:MAG TPA: sensor histidine kinase KdpD [Polyangiaceae bacterium]|nr:sensor histidine kinase KdpD [Polyangiaceae bacterium]
MSEQRPDLESAPKRAGDEETRAPRGKLTIFFGAAPGVGKTYSMLEAARAERSAGRDVLVGIVETHGRYDTGALLLGLELLPRRRVLQCGVILEELDLDLALTRKPALLLVDELEHENAEGSRHAKRHQDVEELLDAGIDVFTSLNVQHIESLNDVVAQITHISVRETVPDSVIEHSDEVRLIDLPPDELLDRLRDGRVYLPDEARRAIEHFFRKGNLIALRELALRRTAERVDAQLQHYRETHGIASTWSVGERLLVCVSPSPLSMQLIRGARRMVSTLHADWLAVYVETPASLRLNASDRARAAENMRLAEQLGAETVILSASNAADETIRYARSRNVTKVVVGKPTHASVWDRLRPSFLDRLVRASGAIDVYVMSGEDSAPDLKPREPALEMPAVPIAFVAAATSVVVSTAISWSAFGPRQLADAVMVYLLGIVLVSLRFGYAPSLLAAVLSVLCFDFFFIPPLYTFAVRDLSHVVTFGVMFMVALVISGLTQRVRAQGDAASQREQRTASLYALSRELAATKQVEDIARIAARHLFDALGMGAALLVPNTSRTKIAPLQVGRHGVEIDEQEQSVAEWVWEHERPAGLGTETLPAARAMYLPLVASRGRVAVLGVRPADSTRLRSPETRQHLAAFANQIASAIERTELAEEAQWAQLQMETEQMRSSLLSSVSHDLRTPLAVVTGAASTLLEDTVDAATRRELTETILQEAQRLNRLVRNLLDMTRLEAGALRVKKEWQPLEEVVGSALNRMEEALSGRHVQIDLAPDLPLVPLDAVLIEQVLVNLLENAVKYTPPGSPLEVLARVSPGGVEVLVSDHGPGIPPGEEKRIFDKFFRVNAASGGGVGLGLAICRGIVMAHGGQLFVENRPAGGALFRFQLPVLGQAPMLVPPEPSPEN